MISNSRKDFIEEFEYLMMEFKRTITYVDSAENTEIALAQAHSAQAQATVIAAMMEKINP